MQIDLSTGERTDSNQNNDNDDGADFITVNGQEIPRIPERIPEGEDYAFINTYGYNTGATVGKSFYSSAAYDEDSPRFPNPAIGQSAEHPEGNLADAVSPGHYWYRTLSAADVKKEFKAAFHEKLDELGLKDKFDNKVSLLTYKMNFPERDLSISDTFKGFSGEMVTIEEADDEWNNVQIPVEWEEEYGGMPPIVMEEVDTEPEPEPEPSEETVEISDEMFAGLNKRETINKALDEIPELREAPQEIAVRELQKIADASPTHTYNCYNDYFETEEAEITDDDTGGFIFGENR